MCGLVHIERTIQAGKCNFSGITLSLLAIFHCFGSRGADGFIDLGAGEQI